MAFNHWNKIATLILTLITIVFIVLTYGIILQLNYPFAHLPISDSLRDSLKQQTSAIIERAGLWGTFMLITFAIISVFEYVGTFNKYKTEEAYNVSERLERFRFLTMIIFCTISVAGIVDDIVFHCPEDMPLAEFALARLSHNLLAYVVGALFDLTIALVIFLIAKIVIEVRRIRAFSRLRQAQSDEELGTASEAVVLDSNQEVIKVPLLKDGFEQKDQGIDEKDMERSVDEAI
ncbi:hypothetical protein K435DRAFT_784629 [Dendrothele bispora CBS 962.96]|uniref:Uncharacterized protein n=1 Tax=Dendrothele bispora (strain CBS 962.96) TaxID=1314807 RepID=A0A4S8L1W1_DENBC|nr:hypothetical protein K435DRAFT_784629 [Dendrothele bispora CBS 962.96]